jgi:hypothetical protein
MTGTRFVNPRFGIIAALAIGAVAGVPVAKPTAPMTAIIPVLNRSTEHGHAPPNECSKPPRSRLASRSRTRCGCCN